MNREQEKIGADAVIMHLMDLSPTVKSKSGREYKLWALKALVLALSICDIKRDGYGRWTKSYGIIPVVKNGKKR